MGILRVFRKAAEERRRLSQNAIAELKYLVLTKVRRRPPTPMACAGMECLTLSIRIINYCQYCETRSLKKNLGRLYESQIKTKRRRRCRTSHAMVSTDGVNIGHSWRSMHGITERFMDIYSSGNKNTSKSRSKLSSVHGQLLRY